MPHGAPWLLHNAKEQNRHSRKDEHESPGFFGPGDPKTLPFHMKLCLGGLFIFPLWWIGAVMGYEETDCWSALWQFRCRALSIISVLVITGLAVIHGISKLD
ncbi:hypothetical protein BN14_03373 [Rhizoctonia solani AG-1 IB]|uniref:Uncharacterized protein n=2 Tax=Rhizoctonia solani TaxID=456999 RepID=A0A8H2X726_9AGAM|nr:unnamed protein product [Rhizoctonia solani]CCO29362.1 hypothetical protein BN14_03373 [Rhizoctonia solani AG-1 IB]